MTFAQSPENPLNLSPFQSVATSVGVLLVESALLITSEGIFIFQKMKLNVIFILFANSLTNAGVLKGRIVQNSNNNCTLNYDVIYQKKCNLEVVCQHEEEVVVDNEQNLARIAAADDGDDNNMEHVKKIMRMHHDKKCLLKPVCQPIEENLPRETCISIRFSKSRLN